MKDNIFKDLYNKLLGFFRQAEESSKDVATSRLRVVLMQDRTNLTPQVMEKMRSELVKLLSKYLEMDNEALELNLEQDGNQMALMLSIPVIRAKSEDEIVEEVEEEKVEEELEEDADDDEASDTDSDIDDEDDDEIDEVAEDIVVLTEEFPNKEVCGECRECELSDEIDCEKKKKVKSDKK